MMPNSAPAARLVLPRLLLLKAEHHHDGMYKHRAGYYLLNGRWHKVKDKPVPKGVPQAAHKHAAGQFAPVQHFTDEQWQQLQLPAENSNASSFNKQLANLKAMSEAGDVTGILGMSVGTNTYGKKLATIANHLLGLHGTEHQVAPGQKAGTHAAVQLAPEPEAVPAAAAPAPAPAPEPQPATPEPTPAAAAPADGPAMPEFAEGKTTSGVKAYYDKVAQQVLAAAGDAAALEKIKADGQVPNAKGKVTNTWAGKTANSKVLLAWHAQLLAQASGGQAAVPEPAQAVEQPAAPPPAAEPAPQPAAAMPTPAGKLDLIPWDKQPLPDENKNAKSHNKQVEKIKAMAYAGDVAGLEAFKAGSNTYGKKQNLLAQTALAALKEDGAPAATAPASVAAPELPEPEAIHGEQPEMVAPADTPAAAAPVEMPEKPKVGGYAAQIASNTQKYLNDGMQQELQWTVDGIDAQIAKAPNPVEADQLAQVKVYAQQALAFVQAGKPTAAAEQGPKDGDTKPGADGGTLVFKNGRWHKQDEPQLAQHQAEAAPAAPVYNPIAPKYAISLGAGLKTSVGNKAKLKAWAVAGDGQALQHFIDTEGQTKPASKKYAENLLGAMSVAPATAPAAKPAPKPATPAAAPEAPPALEAIDAWQQTGPQGGSNPGGRFKDADGVEWYCKFPADDDIAKSEVLAAKLYGAAGVAGQDAKLITKGGKIGIASRWVTVSKAKSPAELAKAQGAQSGFAVDAWLANWDVVGLGYDNLQIGADGKAVRVDAGGSLQYRAQGSKKPFGAKVDEIDTLRDAKVNGQAASIFGKMTTADLTASVAKVAGIEDSQIRALVEEFGPGDKAARDALADTLIARKADLLQRFPKAGKAPKKRLDPTQLPVAAGQLPQPHDFANWHGQGQGLSSKTHINAANNAVEQQAFDTAMAGNLVALKEFKYHGLDKETGNAIGDAIPIAKHPSKHVVQYHSDLVQALDEIANPPEPLKIFKETEAGTLASLQAAFPPKSFGTTVGSVKSNEKMGFWVALGSVANAAAKFAPKKTSDYSSAAIAAAKAKFQDAKKLAKHFISSVQASGSYNDLFRDGKTHDHQGNALTDVAQAALEHATEMPEGTSIYRWQAMTDQMLQHVMSAPDGTVFQATGPMCTSYSPTATKGFGKHRIVIRYAKGAKAVESFASGKFQAEKEVTTLPNNRFIILSKKMVPDVEHGNPSGKRAEIEVLMLPPDLGIPGVKG